MSLLKVLGLLADGEIHSGEEIGEALGISRTAVWKQVQKVSALGLRLITVKGRGYQLPGGLELLDQQKILAGLSMQARDLLKQLEVENTINSTNARAMTKAQQGIGSGYACIAEHQSAGRGRKGRPWISPFGRNIYLSIVWEFAQGAAALEGLSLAVGVAIARVINRKIIGEKTVQLKWPNDVYWQEHKLAGVLLEMSGDVSSVCQVVIGVGLNVAMEAEEAAAIDQRWASLQQFVDGVSRNQLAAELLEEILVLLNTFSGEGFRAVKEEWEGLDYFQDKEVEIRIGDHLMVGRAAGVSDSGALRLLTPAGEKLVYGGEASARVNA